MAGLLTPQRQTAGNGLLDQPRRVDDRVAGLLGLDPSIQRGAILPFGRDASGEMVMAWPEMALDTLKALMLPGHVVQGGEFTPRDVTEMALDMGMLSTVAPAPAGAKRMFGGISAKNAPLDDLAKAEAMEKAGEAADDIWRATGWGRGADQKWRFEIDDSGAKWTDEGYQGLMGDTNLVRARDGIDHAPLGDAYPEMMDRTGIMFTDGGIGGATGNYRDGLVTLDRRGDKDVVLHELQHAVQQREGFARGGSPEYGVTGPIAYPTDLPRWDVLDAADKIRRVADQTGDAPAAVASKYRGAFKIDDESMQQALDFANSPELPAMVERGRGFAEMKPFEAYRRLAGEVEARNVQKRMDMDAATRRATPPWSTEDVPRDQQIVRGLLSGDGPQMSASLPMDEASRMAPALKKWFGDSKVVDENGGPLVVYHGTSAENDFDVFRNGEFGHHFGKAFQAQAILDDKLKAAHELDQKYGRPPQEMVPNARIMPVYVRIEKPLRLDDMGDFSPESVAEAAAEAGAISRGAAEGLIRRMTSRGRDALETRDAATEAVKKELEAWGYDGIVYKNTEEIGPAGEIADSYIAFRPEQIKSATGNRGTYDPDDPSILASYLGIPGAGLLPSATEDDRRGLLND
jgi:hypothetical protein